MRRKESPGDKKPNRALEEPENRHTLPEWMEQGRLLNPGGRSHLPRKTQAWGLEGGPSLRLYKHDHQLDLTAICRAPQTSTLENSFFSNAHRSLTETDQILGHKINHDEVNRTEIIQSMCQIII